MTDEQIKEIVVAAINSGLIVNYTSGEKTAEGLAEFINILKEKIIKVRN